MHVLLNELSHQDGERNVEKKIFESVTKGLIEAIKFFKSISNVQVIYWTSVSDIHNVTQKFFDNKSYKEYLGSVSREERGILLALFGKLNHLKNEDNICVREKNTGGQSFSVLPYIRLEGVKFGSVSLFSQKIWEVGQLRFETQSDEVVLRNWPKIEFAEINAYLKCFKSYYSEFVGEIQQGEGFLPNAVLSNRLLSENSFVDVYSKFAGGERLAAFQMVGDLIAILNGYKVHQEANRKNKTAEKKRNIYFNEILQRFVSIDYEKGAFELLDANGKHLGEYSFAGKSISGPDDKGKHDILL